MTRMNSRPVSQTVVFAQDTQPSAARDGLLWVDTSESSRPVYVYSSTTSSWEPTAPGNVTVSDTAPTGKATGHRWVDTSASPPVVKTYDGAKWVPDGTRMQGYVDVGGSRSSGTWYQNTNDHALVVYVRGGDSSYQSSGRAHSNSTQSNQEVGRCSQQGGQHGGFQFVVPAGHYYKVDNLSRWGPSVWREAVMSP